MKWNINSFLKSTRRGVISELSISRSDYDTLVTSRRIIRKAIRQTFSDIRQALSTGSSERQSKLFKSLPKEIVDAILMLEPHQQTMIGKLKPVFFTQGSFTYGTLNRPAFPPEQQLDLDDGVYLPIEFFENSPVVGKNVFFLIIDTILTRLCEENPKWEGPSFKTTCARINVAPHIHIDIPLYAIPEDEYENLEKSRQSKTLMLESLSKSSSYDDLYTRFLDSINESMVTNQYSAYAESRYLSPDKIYLAKRDDKEHWMPSDPALVARWFENAALEHGKPLVNTCRYLKAWRDTTYSPGGPSGPTSLTLMACAVATFDNYSGDTLDDHGALLLCTEALPQQLRAGVPSPDPSDERNLFPKGGMKQYEIEDIIQKAQALYASLRHGTYQAETKEESKRNIATGIGVHVRPVPAELIVPHKAYKEVVATPVTKKPPREVPNLRSGANNE
ncbi:CBASS cGAMP synthase [Vibrio rotiferianus]|uniref:CBASS cGAMP synthase n=1 Tax=Vibrio rotiferianus TaxID=190895 RepID=UPI0028957977|nr:putative Cyclic GMP-AMP synthase [Vibrio rotiferianus]CAH1558374.1 putative Cyclic GMP-AMP synthase [Vibrio rotiferianus]